VEGVKTVANSSSSNAGVGLVNATKAYRLFGVLALAAIIGFGQPLIELLRASFRTDLYSHIPLIPVIAAYFVWLKRNEVASAEVGSKWWGFAFLGLALGVTALSFFIHPGAKDAPTSDVLSARVFGFYCVILASAFLCFGGSTMKTLAFPAALLIFIVPFPNSVLQAIEAFFQYTSAEAAYAMIRLSGTPILRDGLLFQLPGISISVAPECSGIRSSLVLFITSLLAGQVFLRNRLNRTVLALFVVPLAIVRNGFRIFTIAMLCVHVDPDMINSYIHKRGGPIFFVLSLVPFFVLMLWLVRRERWRAIAREGVLQRAEAAGRTG
jgi:exosortase C (VPDSG-CTERM-specific)